MSTKDITSMRGAIDFLKERGEILIASNEIDPVYEIVGVQKALEDGPALMFENIKGYPNVRVLGNVFSRKDRVAAIFDVDDPSQLKSKCVQALKNPLPPRVVEMAPCQEVVTTDNIDVMGTIPITKYTEADGERILGSGIILTMEPYYPGGSDLAYRRIHFRGRDWASIHIVGSTHMGYVHYLDRKDERIPVTINICPSPAIMMVAATSTIHVIVPYGTDELGIAGALQGCPIDICRAKTVDACAIANSEWVIEGYILPEKVWETKEAENLAKPGVAPLFPEWHGYMGKAVMGFKFQATAMTHRKDRPIFYNSLASCFEYDNQTVLRQACFLELAERIAPGLVIDVSIPHFFKSAGGVVFQVRKRTTADDSVVKNILEGSILLAHVRIAIAVDDDIKPESADELLWAIWSRTNLDRGLIRTARGSRGMGLIPAVDVRPGSEYEGGLGIDATIPFAYRGQFQRAHHPVDRVDLRKWFSEEELAAVQASQCEYARLLAKTGA